MAGITDFVAFRNLAKAAFPKFNISAMIWEKEQARSLPAMRFRLKADGPGLLEAVSVEAHTAEAAVQDLKPAIARGRRAYATEAAITSIAREVGGLDIEVAEHIRERLMKCPLLAFDGLVASIRQAAKESAAEVQAA